MRGWYQLHDGTDLAKTKDARREEGPDRVQRGNPEHDDDSSLNDGSDGRKDPKENA